MSGRRTVPQNFIWRINTIPPPRNMPLGKRIWHHLTVGQIQQANMKAIHSNHMQLSSEFTLLLKIKAHIFQDTISGTCSLLQNWCSQSILFDNDPACSINQGRQSKPQEKLCAVATCNVTNESYPLPYKLFKKCKTCDTLLPTIINFMNNCSIRK